MFLVAVEWLRFHIAGLAFGDGFPFLQLGTSQAQHERLIQIADMGGVAAVSWLVATVNGALYVVAAALLSGSRRASLRRSLRSLAFAAMVVGAALLYGAARLRDSPDPNGPTIGIVSGRFELKPGPRTEELRSEIVAGLEAEAVSTANSGIRTAYPDLLVWKEGALSGTLFLEQAVVSRPSTASQSQVAGQMGKTLETTERLDSLQRIADQLGCSLVIGCKRQAHAEDEKYNSVVFVDRQQGDFAYYDKQHLAPLFEFRPQLANALGLLPPTRSGRPRESRFRHGTQQCAFQLTGKSQVYRLGPSICYDLFFPAKHRRMVESAEADAGLDLFIGATNERRAQGTTFPELSHTMQRFRAIECRRAYVRNAECGNSAIVDSRGRLVPAVELTNGDGRSILIGRVPLRRDRGVYLVLGDWLPILACVSVASLLIFSVVTRPGIIKPNRKQSHDDHPGSARHQPA
jgi:apolipoprotein N-acyltransferase